MPSLRFFHGFGLLCGALIGLHFLLPRGGGAQAVVYELVGVAAIAAVVGGIRLHRPDRTLHLWAVVLGLLLLSFGDLLFNLDEFVLERDAYPAFGDWLYLAGYVPLVAAVGLLVRSRQRLATGDALDATIVLCGAGTLFWFSLIDPVATDGSASVAARVVSVGYPTLDVLLLVTLAQLVTTGGAGSVSFRLFAAGAGVLLVADVLYGLQTLDGSYAPGGWLDLGWMTHTTLWGLAALHPSIRTLHLHAPERSARLTWRRLFLLCVTALVAPVAMLRFADQDRFGVSVVAAAAAVTTLLIFVRMMLLFREHGRAVAALLEAEARREVEEAVREGAERFRAAARALDCAVYEWRLDATEVVWTDGLHSVFGHVPESIVSDNDWFYAHVHPDDTDRLHRLEEEMREGRISGEISYRFRHADGSYREVLDRWEQLSDGRVLGGMVDVTERRRLERHYEQAQKLEAVGRLAGGIAHDFNNILTAISGNAELLATSERLGDSEREDVKEIVRAAERAATLTAQLLTFSRRGSPEAGTTNVNEAVESTRAMLARLLGPDVAIETDLDPRAGQVELGSVAVEQVLLNLALNARDAMDGSGTLTIETRASGADVELVVSDSGCGMEDEVLVHVFEPFFTTKPPGKGTGLGLSTVYGIVDHAGGTIAIDTRPGEGTTFVVTLPAAEASGLPPGPAAPAHGSEQILLVDDEAPVRLVIARMLRAHGYRVVEAAGPEDALSRFDDPDFGPDLVVSDLVMPRVNGWKLAEQIEARRPGTRFLFVSGYSDHDALAGDGVPSGAQLLHKPFGGDELAAATRAALDAEHALALAG